MILLIIRQYYEAMQMRQIEAFRAVMLSGGITAAAAMLHISQPSVSRLISDLERAIGFQLFERHGRRLMPTRRAETFFDAVRQSFTGLDLLEQTARRIRAHPVETLRVAALPALAGGVLPQAIALFHDRFPDIKVTVEAQNQRAIEDRVFLGQADLGLGVQAQPKQGIRTATLAKAEYVCVLPADHRLASRPLIHVSDLEGESLIGPMHEADAIWDAIDRTFLSEEVSVTRFVETQLSYPAYCFVEAGLGVMVAEPFSAPLFRRLGVCVRRFRPTISLNFTVMESDNIGPTPGVVESFRDIVHKVTAELLADVERLTLEPCDSGDGFHGGGREPVRQQPMDPERSQQIGAGGHQEQGEITSSVAEDPAGRLQHQHTA
ncbi:LysR family transcriptional regulator [Telmatospirillum siberiense]|uniref:LysR family transcriptional regulator n=2 Tax=Telmatospirillum siberiense TaxID=382514 RepID=A0A2N3PXS2_9PROT|nr:LysR family transcriptional regulator [Telmatospirillum siberiense]